MSQPIYVAKRDSRPEGIRRSRVQSVRVRYEYPCTSSCTVELYRNTGICTPGTSAIAQAMGCFATKRCSKYEYLSTGSTYNRSNVRSTSTVQVQVLYRDGNQSYLLVRSTVVAYTELSATEFPVQYVVLGSTKYR